MGLLGRLMRAWHRVLLVGSPGLGKTERILAMAASLGMAKGDIAEVQRSQPCCVVRRLSLQERTDFGGCYVPDVTGGVTRALPLELMHALQRTTAPTLLFLDDLGQGPDDVQASCMQLTCGSTSKRSLPSRSHRNRAVP